MQRQVIYKTLVLFNILLQLLTINVMCNVGYKVECVGDDIAWMHFDKEGRLRAINPENGFFGVAPGTNYATNPNACYTFLYTF